VVLLAGEAGIGKSRLTAALLERLTSEPHTRLRYFCSPQHTDSALYPIIGQMQRAAGLALDDTLQAKLDKLDVLLGQTSTSTQDAALFAEMLSLSNDGRYPALDLDAQRRRQRTLQALILQVEVLSRSNPVLMILEDAHWADPTSLEAIGRAVDRIRALRVLLLVTFRPEFDPPWIGRAYVTTLTINRLAERESKANNAVKNAREIGQAATLMYALSNATWSQIYCGNYEAATALVQELLPLAQEKDAAYWTAFGTINQGVVSQTRSRC
jgi:predicted ATPase